MKEWKPCWILVFAVITMAASVPCAGLGAHADEEGIRTLTDKENNSGQWERMFTAISGKILTFEVIQDKDIVYAGTEDGLYRMSGPVYDWEKLDLPGGLPEVKDIVSNGENL
ncbi:MAG: hypothetical protein ABIA77_02220, partial [Candidatus Omnitrophota bacterium]